MKCKKLIFRTMLTALSASFAESGTDVTAVLSEAVGEKEGLRAHQAVRAILPEQGERPARGS